MNMMPVHDVVVLTFHVGALTYLNTSKCSHASLHLGKVGSCKQPLSIALCLGKYKVVNDTLSTDFDLQGLSDRPILLVKTIINFAEVK